MTITQPLALTAGYMKKQFVNVGQTQQPDVFGSLANTVDPMDDAAAFSLARAEGYGTHAVKRSATYVTGGSANNPVAGTVSGKVACCAPNQDFLRDFYDAASQYGGTVPANIIP